MVRSAAAAPGKRKRGFGRISAASKGGNKNLDFSEVNDYNIFCPKRGARPFPFSAGCGAVFGASVTQAIENAQNGHGRLLLRVGMDLGLIWGWRRFRLGGRHDGVASAPQSPSKDTRGRSSPVRAKSNSLEYIIAYGFPRRPRRGAQPRSLVTVGKDAY
jgi:hypothetical protein